MKKIVEPSHSALKLARMQIADVDEVVAIDAAVYSHPWSKGNFLDSLAQDADAWVVRSDENVILGYFVQIPMVDESHLLTIAVKKDVQGLGVGRFLLQQVIRQARLMKMTAVSLEVRVSNLRAIAVYGMAGFVEVGCRKNYYEATKKQTQAQREDALILRYELS